MPSASAIEAMVEAVPIVSCSCRPSGSCAASASRNSSSVISPAFTISENFPDGVPEPTSLAAELAVQHRAAGDDDRRAGRRTAAPISSDGVVLSQPTEQHDSRPSAGRGSPPRRPWPPGCGTSSPSGGSVLSQAENTGNSTGKPPASLDAALHLLGELAQMRRCTASAPTRCCRMPMTGRPSNSVVPDRPWFFIQQR